MKEEVKRKFDTISNVWRSYIWEYQFCRRNINFKVDFKDNYFGQILGYFQDTFDIIFENREVKSYSDKFSNNIGLLQSIYVQQDFIEEMLIIFKTRINKGDLKKDENYSINREIRNELVGHPIRKIDGEFISSSLFAYERDASKIVYLRYHKNNDFKFESMSMSIVDIRKRHRAFLNTYFDAIIVQLKKVLALFRKELDNLLRIVDGVPFNKLLDLTSIYFESIHNSDYIYDRDTLKEVYQKKDENPRYQNVIDEFYNDLKNILSEVSTYSKELFDEQTVMENKEISFESIIIETEEKKLSSNELPEEDYGYELGKIGTKKDFQYFLFMSGILRRKCQDNELVLNELDHMTENWQNDLEFYSSYKLICKKLKF